MLRRAPPNLPHLLAIHPLKSATSSVESRKRLCKSWPSGTRTDLLSEPTSVLDIHSPSPSSTLSSSIPGSGFCESGSLGGGLASLNHPVNVSSIFTDATASAHGRRSPDCSNLLDTEDGSAWRYEEGKNIESAIEADGIIAAVSNWSADVEMGGNPSNWDQRGTHPTGVSESVEGRNTSEGPSTTMTDMISGRNIMVSAQQQAEANLLSFVQKMDTFSFPLQCTGGSCDDGCGDRNILMQAQQQQQQVHVPRSEEWLLDLQSLPSTESQVEDPERVASLAIDDVESMLLSSPSLPPPPPDHSLMKLLFGEVEDSMLSLHHQQKQLNKELVDDSNEDQQEHKQLDLQEAIDAHCSSSGLFRNINSQAAAAVPSAALASLFHSAPNLSDLYFPIDHTDLLQPNLCPTFSSNFHTGPLPPFYTADLSPLLNANRLCQSQQNHLPLVDSPISSSFPPYGGHHEPAIPRDARLSPSSSFQTSYQTCVSPPNFSSGRPSLEKTAPMLAKLPQSSVCSPPNRHCISLPMSSGDPQTRIQKSMVNKLSRPEPARQSFLVPSSASGSYMEPTEQKKFYGPQSNDLLDKAMPPQLNPEPGWQAAVAKITEDHIPRMVKQEIEEQMRPAQAAEGRFFSLNRRDIQLPELHRLSEWVKRGKVGGDDVQLTTVDQLIKAAEAVELGNIATAQAILARLNQHLFPRGKPLQRAAFYFKQALGRVAGSEPSLPARSNKYCGLDILKKITAYKTFCEFSLLPQFAYFTANQAILESMEGESSIHLIDFELGLGEQWASFLQEVAVRPGGPPKLRITTIGAESVEMQLTRENLYQFARTLNVSLDFQVISVGKLDDLTASMFRIAESEAVAVNFTFVLKRLLTAFSSADSVTGFFQLIKHLSPSIVIVADVQSECDGASFVKQFVDALQLYASLFASLESTTNLPMETILNIEEYLFTPMIDSLVEGRTSNKTYEWPSLLRKEGFSPLAFSPIAEAQVHCLLQNRQTCSRGFDVIKREDSLLLGWQGRNVVTASAWSC